MTCATSNNTIVNAVRTSFVPKSSGKSVCVDNQRQVFGINTSKVCIETGKTPPQIRYQRDIWAPSALNQITSGQTMFLLSQTPKNPEDSFHLTINGQTQRYDLDYSVSGSVLTFIDDIWGLIPKDTAMMLYNY